MSRSLTLTGTLGVLATLAFAQLACGDKDDDGDDSGASDGGAAEDGGAGEDGGSGDGGTTDEGISATISGHVDVQFFTEGDDGERDYIAWADTPWADAFPFGSIFVAATTENKAGGLTYRGDTTVLHPSIDGDDYVLGVSMPDDGDVQVYATLDMYGDGILSTDEPFGIYPGVLTVTDEAELDHANVTILVDYDEYYAWWMGGGGGGGGGGCDAITLSGSSLLTSPWTDGDIAVLLYDVGNNGPYYYDRDQPVEAGAGAQADFSFAVCANLGDMKLRGAWDNNGNGLIDPSDLWGGYVSAPDTSANPIDIGSVDLTDLEVQIPLGTGEAGLDISPFVSLAGDVTVNSGSFDDLAEGSVVYVTALMYRPSGDFAIADMAEYTYDNDFWTVKDYAGKSSLPFTLWVPADTVVYLWAYADLGPKPDGILNQVGELVASAGSDANGRIATGSSSTSGYTLDLGLAR